MSLHVCLYLQNAKKNEKNVNNEFWLHMICQYMFISCNKWITLLGYVNNIGGHARVEIGVL